MFSQYPDNFFDIAIDDPQYGIGESSENHKSRNTPVKQKNGSKLTIKDNSYEKSDWDDSRPSREYFQELFRVSKHQIIWGGNYFTDLLPEHSSGRIIWDKVNGSNDFSDCEIAWTNLFQSTRLIRYMWNGMMQGKSISEGHIQQGNKKLNEKRIHATQKPVILYDKLLKDYAKEGFKICDGHLGSASIAIAIYNQNTYENKKLKLYACEIDPVMFHKSIKRIEPIINIQTIFNN